MADWLPRDSRDTGHRWHDDRGALRVMTRWGFNAHVTPEGAKADAERIGRPGTTWYLWRLADGSYDISAIDNPEGPGYPAEMAEEIWIPGVLDRRTIAGLRRRRAPATQKASSLSPRS
jgi:hypothetical protein